MTSHAVLGLDVFVIAIIAAVFGFDGVEIQISAEGDTAAGRRNPEELLDLLQPYLELQLAQPCLTFDEYGR